jgi:hypothetical protein
MRGEEEEAGFIEIVAQGVDGLDAYAGSITCQAGSAYDGGIGGDIKLFAGNAEGSSGEIPGSIYLYPGVAAGTKANGYVNIKTGMSEYYASLDTSGIGDDRIYKFPSKGGTIALIGDASNTKTYTWTVSTPAAGFILGPKLKEAHTWTSIDSYVAGTGISTVSFNIDCRKTIGTGSSVLINGGMTSNVTGVSVTSFSRATSAANEWLYLGITAIGGTNGQLVVTLTGTV